MSSENFFSFKVKNAKGTQEDLGSYKGKAVLVVNVASKCGFTPQYEGLEQLYKDYKDKGLMIVGFPCNQFGAQEPGSDAEVQDFCKMNFGVSFPVMAKIDVNGDEADPLYKWLKSTKFLIGKDGQVIERFAPTTKPKELTASIESAIG
jgi:glutathione peroxidase